MPAIGPDPGAQLQARQTWLVSLVELRVGSSHELSHVTYGMIHDACHEEDISG